MAKLSRKTQKIFASNSAQNQVSTFGSIKAGAVAYSKDVSNIQTEAFEGGWSSAVQDDYAPYRQDRNAVDFVTTSQLAYVFQEGVPEYDANTTYYKGSWVKGLDGDTYAIYESLSDDNIGNNLSDEEKWEAKSFGGGLEIGDIGIAPLGVNEAQNKRRYLNGQVISQAQFVSFTDKLKEAIRLNPRLATSEVNWQATVTNSVLGQCGKFVVDDELGTIRLPKVVNVQGLADLTLMGSIKDESLPNITGSYFEVAGLSGTISNASGAFSNSKNYETVNFGGGSGNMNTAGISFDASLSSSTYQDNAPVQQEAIQYPYFIQVATGVEESVDVTREIELNNPFSLLDYKWSEYELNNASWLISNGIFHNGTVYTAVYELLLKIKNGVVTKEGVSVKLSTEIYADTDFVINTADTTFRLPIKVKLASGNAVVGNGTTLGLMNTTRTAGLYHVSGGLTTRDTVKGLPIGSTASSSAGIAETESIGVSNDPTRSGIETSSSGLKLYFYVGETIQDANVIAASQVLTTVADCVRKSSARDRETVIRWIMPDYTAGVQVAGNTNYTAPCDGIFVGNSSIYVNGVEVSHFVSVVPGYNSSNGTPFYVEKGDICKATSSDVGPKFYPLKGVN